MSVEVRHSKRFTMELTWTTWCSIVMFYSCLYCSSCQQEPQYVDAPIIGEVIEGQTCPSVLRQEIAVRRLRDEVTSALVPERRRSARYGGTGNYDTYYNFDEFSPNIDEITSIELYHNIYYQTVGLRVTYLMKDGSTLVSSPRGGSRYLAYPYTLSDGEFFVKLDGTIINGGGYITNLTLVTNYGIKHSVVATGASQGETFSIDAGNELISIYGNHANSVLRYIGVDYRVCQLCRQPGG